MKITKEAKRFIKTASDMAWIFRRKSREAATRTVSHIYWRESLAYDRIAWEATMRFVKPNDK